MNLVSNYKRIYILGSILILTGIFAVGLRLYYNQSDNNLSQEDEQPQSIDELDATSTTINIDDIITSIDTTTHAIEQDAQFKQAQSADLMRFTRDIKTLYPQIADLINYYKNHNLETTQLENDYLALQENVEQIQTNIDQNNIEAAKQSLIYSISLLKSLVQMIESDQII